MQFFAADLQSGSTVIALLILYIVVPVCIVVAATLTVFVLYSLIKREKITKQTMRPLLAAYGILVLSLAYLFTRS